MTSPILRIPFDTGVRSCDPERQILSRCVRRGIQGPSTPGVHRKDAALSPTAEWTSSCRRCGHVVLTPGSLVSWDPVIAVLQHVVCRLGTETRNGTADVRLRARRQGTGPLMAAHKAGLEGSSLVGVTAEGSNRFGTDGSDIIRYSLPPSPRA